MSLAKLVTIASALVFSLVPASAVAAQGATGMIPGGSYVESCKDITFDAATNMLNATCDFNDPEGLWMKGEPVRSSEGFDVTGCVPNSIFNDDGSLFCFTEKPWGSGRRIPKGSYLASCTRSRVANNVLIAECDDRSDETKFTELNLNGCQWGGDISNSGGHLACEPRTAAADTPALVKPVPVAPLAKPVTVAPLSPGASTATESPLPRRSKKKRGNPGERG